MPDGQSIGPVGLAILVALVSYVAYTTDGEIWSLIYMVSGIPMTRFLFKVSLSSMYSGHAQLQQLVEEGGLHTSPYTLFGFYVLACEQFALMVTPVSFLLLSACYVVTFLRFGLHLALRLTGDRTPFVL